MRGTPLDGSLAATFFFDGVPPVNWRVRNPPAAHIPRGKGENARRQLDRGPSLGYLRAIVDMRIPSSDVFLYVDVLLCGRIVIGIIC